MISTIHAFILENENRQLNLVVVSLCFVDHYFLQTNIHHCFDTLYSKPIM